MRPILVALGFALVLTFTALPAEACHGTRVTVPNSVPSLGLTCNACPVFYFLSGPLEGARTVLALYQESNGIPDLQRGARPMFQGGYDHCWQGPSLDSRIF